MSFGDQNKGLQEILEPFTGPQRSAFDTPEARATTAFVARQSATMALQIEADKRRSVIAVKDDEIQG